MLRHSTLYCCVSLCGIFISMYEMVERKCVRRDKLKFQLWCSLHIQTVMFLVIFKLWCSLLLVVFNGTWKKSCKKYIEFFKRVNLLFIWFLFNQIKNILLSNMCFCFGFKYREMELSNKINLGIYNFYWFNH